MSTLPTSFRHGLRHVPIWACATLGSLSATAAAMDTPFVGPRGLGMGGANVACVDDSEAQFYNPAAFGFFGLPPSIGESDNNDLGRKHWGFDVDAEAGVVDHGSFGSYLNTVANADLNHFATSGVQNQTDLQNAVALANALGNITDSRSAATVDGNAGASLRIGHFGVGFRTSAAATVLVNQIDTTHLGIGGPGSLATQIAGIASPTNGVQLFTPAQQAAMSGAGFSASDIQKIDYLARQGSVSPAQTQGLVNLIDQVNVQGASGTINQNTTSATVDGFGLLEVPVSYGLAFNGHLSVGASAKLMVGRVYGANELVYNNSLHQAVSDVRHDYDQSVHVGVDAGILARLPLLNIGLTGRNLNAPSFAGPTINGVTYPSVRLDPQVTAGVAFIPWSTFTLEADCDLLHTQTTFPGYDDRRVGFGGEWNILHTLALRAGTYRNLSEDDIGWVYTGGVGINLWLMRLDLAGAFSPHRAVIQGRDIPDESRVSLQVEVDF